MGKNERLATDYLEANGWEKVRSNFYRASTGATAKVFKNGSVWFDRPPANSYDSWSTLKLKLSELP